jgi:hypothetical protein
MALFNKKKKEEVSKPSEFSDMPTLPALPPLPKLPEFTSDNTPFKPNALPRFPSNSLGNKFSQNTIKDAISGEKEDEEEMANESEEVQTMPKLPEGPLTHEVSSMNEFPPDERRIKPMYSQREPKGGPMFVRLDKFEENLEIFEKIKRQLVGVEKILEDIKRTKDQEDKELEDWLAKLQTMKEQIDKIDRDIFSKAE